MSAKTLDRATVHDRNVFHLADRIGEKRSVTPEGFLVCHDVPIARTGTQLYSDAEVPIEGAPDGIVRVERLPEEVFRPETLASFEGKPVTVEHPDDFVTPDNWSRVAVGYAQNVRRGEGLDDDLILADLVITDAGAIAYVNEKLPEVSAGYSAEYEQTGPGRGVQRQIVGNHVALVDNGRAGPRCAIQDHQPKDPDMKTKDPKPSAVKTLASRLRAFFDSELEKMEKDSDEEEQKKKTDDEEEIEVEVEEKTKDEDGAIEARIARIEAALAKLLPLEEQEHGVKMGDDERMEPVPGEKNPEAKGTVLSGDSLREVIARAEILAPGHGALKTADGKGVKASTVEAHMRAALAKADDANVAPFLLGRTVDSLKGEALVAVFNGAAELARHRNNGRTTDMAALRQRAQSFGGAPSPADINAKAAAFWKQGH